MINQNQLVATKVNIPIQKVESTIKLLNEGATIPFIARYRKEVTGNLNEVEISEISKASAFIKELEKRKEHILNSIDEQGKLSAELKEKITECTNSTVLEDIYLPFKPRKETKADKARKAGLEPLAKMIMSQRVDNLNQLVKRFTNNIIKSHDEAFEGARHIISEWMNERQSLRDRLRRQIERNGKVVSKLVKGKLSEAEKFKDYFDWEEDLYRIPAHRFLAISRGEKLGYLRFKISMPKGEMEDFISSYFTKGSNPEINEQIKLAAKDAWKRLLHPALENEFKKFHKEKADKTSIKVFGENLKQLLLAAPLGERRILAIDPGFRTGCKLVCLDETGKLLYNETIYPHPPKNDSKQAIKKLATLASSYKIDAIAIGDGTAGRETDQLVQRISFDRKIQSFMVNENGASIYSASKVARDEFPDYDITVRGAVSIGRRLMDPLAELVKIDPKSIGVGQYQHDVDQKLLKESLDYVVESAVNQVGVNLNTASIHVLKYIAGVGPKLAERIIEYRNEKGIFGSRAELKKVKGFGELAFQQASGFLRIYKEEFSLDATGIHPEMYSIIQKILKANKIQLSELKAKKEVIDKIDFKAYSNTTFGDISLQDAKNELIRAGVDVRRKKKQFQFDSNFKNIEQLKIGMTLPGLVSNITNFGAFVNIGIKQDGLVHLSNMANEFVKDPNEFVHLGKQVIVKVLEVDIKRNRIQLSMKD